MQIPPRRLVFWGYVFGVQSYQKPLGGGWKRMSSGIWESLGLRWWTRLLEMIPKFDCDYGTHFHMGRPQERTNYLGQ